MGGANFDGFYWMQSRILFTFTDCCLIDCRNASVHERLRASVRGSFRRLLGVWANWGQQGERSAVLVVSVSVLRTWDHGMFIPDPYFSIPDLGPGSLRPQIYNKELSTGVLTWLRKLEIWSGMFIPDSDFCPSRIPARYTKSQFFFYFFRILWIWCFCRNRCLLIIYHTLLTWW